MKYTLMVCACLLALAQPAAARPVSYPGGWTVMQNNDMMSHSLHVHYSPTAQYSIGYKGEYFRDHDWLFNGVQGNYLVHRWNEQQSQANLYVKGLFGTAHSDYKQFDGKDELASGAEIATDWETRRYFASYSARYLHAGEIGTVFAQRARVGIAPYIGDYGDTHSWFMLQFDHVPTRYTNLTVTPMIRLFKGEYLAEAGISHKGDVMFNWIIRF